MVPATDLTRLRGRVGDDVASTLHRAAESGFLGGMPVDEQIDHALGFVVATEQAIGHPPSSVADLGTGGGVPGLVLHSCWPQCRLVLMDGSQRRTEFLSAAIEPWDSPCVEVARGRAEDLARDGRYRLQFELVTARSFAAPAVTAECGAPLLADGGVMVVSEPPGEPEPGRWPVEGLGKLGLVPGRRARVDDRFNYQVLLRSSEVDDRYPRRVGIPSKRPLF